MYNDMTEKLYVRNDWEFNWGIVESDPVGPFFRIVSHPLHDKDNPYFVAMCLPGCTWGNSSISGDKGALERRKRIGSKLEYIIREYPDITREMINPEIRRINLKLLPSGEVVELTPLAHDWYRK